MHQLITTHEVAKRLYTTAYTVRKYIREGKLKAIKLGKQYLIEEENVAAMLQQLCGEAN